MATSLTDVLAGEPGSRAGLLRFEHTDPHTYLGPHDDDVDGRRGTVVRVYHPEAASAELRPGDAEALPMTALGDGRQSAPAPRIEGP